MLVIYRGQKYRRARNLTYRSGEPGDVNSQGDPIPSNYLVIVHGDDCPTLRYEQRGERDVRIIDPKGVKPRKDLQISGHSLTNLAYGMPKREKRWPWDDESTEYTTVYLVFDGQVYTRRIWHDDREPLPHRW